MGWMRWKLSARLAMQDRAIFWFCIILATIVGGTSIFFLWRLLPEGLRSGVITMHYSIYLGIDDVRPWPWMLMIPGLALGVALAEILTALGIFTNHPIAARTLLAIAIATSLVWSIGIFFLVLVNV